MTFTAEQLQENWDKLIDIVETTFEGERKEKLLEMYEYFKDRAMFAPASGVVNSQNQIPTKHTRNQAAADVIQAANSMPTHMNGKIPIRTGSKKNGPSSSIMN